MNNLEYNNNAVTNFNNKISIVNNKLDKLKNIDKINKIQSIVDYIQCLEELIQNLNICVQKLEKFESEDINKFYNALSNRYYNKSVDNMDYDDWYSVILKDGYSSYTVHHDCLIEVLNSLQYNNKTLLIDEEEINTIEFLMDISSNVPSCMDLIRIFNFYKRYKKCDKETEKIENMVKDIENIKVNCFEYMGTKFSDLGSLIKDSKFLYVFDIYNIIKNQFTKDDHNFYYCYITNNPDYKKEYFTNIIKQVRLFYNMKFYMLMDYSYNIDCLISNVIPIVRLNSVTNLSIDYIYCSFRCCIIIVDDIKDYMYLSIYGVMDKVIYDEEKKLFLIDNLINGLENEVNVKFRNSFKSFDDDLHKEVNSLMSVDFDYKNRRKFDFEKVMRYRIVGIKDNIEYLEIINNIYTIFEMERQLSVAILYKDNESQLRIADDINKRINLVLSLLRKDGDCECANIDESKLSTLDEIELINMYFAFKKFDKKENNLNVDVIRSYIYKRLSKKMLNSDYLKYNYRNYLLQVIKSDNQECIDFAKNKMNEEYMESQIEFWSKRLVVSENLIAKDSVIATNEKPTLNERKFELLKEELELYQLQLNEQSPLYEKADQLLLNFDDKKQSFIDTVEALNQEKDINLSCVYVKNFFVINNVKQKDSIIKEQRNNMELIIKQQKNDIESKANLIQELEKKIVELENSVKVWIAKYHKSSDLRNELQNSLTNTSINNIKNEKDLIIRTKDEQIEKYKEDQRVLLGYMRDFDKMIEKIEKEHKQEMEKAKKHTQESLNIKSKKNHDLADKIRVYQIYLVILLVVIGVLLFVVLLTKKRKS